MGEVGLGSFDKTVTFFGAASPRWQAARIVTELIKRLRAAGEDPIYDRAPT